MLTTEIGTVEPAGAPTGFYERHGRRLLDVTLAAAALILLLPVLGTIALAIRIRMGLPVLFHDRRAGRHGQPFRLIKFRTMRHAVDARGQLRPDEARLTPLGRWLRRRSLDELPELLNVVRGDMSLVGPRPLPVRYLARYTPAQARRLEVKPGVTGVSQVRGRNALTWEQKFRLDIWYVDHRSLALDLWLLAQTAPAVIRAQGINQAGHATMEEFSGSS